MLDLVIISDNDYNANENRSNVCGHLVAEVDITDRNFHRHLIVMDTNDTNI